MRAYPLATLVSGEPGSALISLIPLVVHGDPETPVLLGHLDKNNDQSGSLIPGAGVSFHFKGPDSYASPDLYSKDHLPGWLYVSVQGNGRVRDVLNNDELRELLVDSTRYFGSENQRFRLDQSDKRIDQFINRIHGFRIEVSTIQGIAKLAQDKGLEDSTVAKDFLASLDNERSLLLFDRILSETL